MRERRSVVRGSAVVPVTVVLQSVEAEESSRIPGNLPASDLEVKVRPRRVPALPDQRDALSGGHVIAGADQQRRVVRVHGHQVACVLDDQQVSVAADGVPRVNDLAIGGGVDRRAARRRQIDPLVRVARARPERRADLRPLAAASESAPGRTPTPRPAAAGRARPRRRRRLPAPRARGADRPERRSGVRPSPERPWSGRSAPGCPRRGRRRAPRARPASRRARRRARPRAGRRGAWARGIAPGARALATSASASSIGRWRRSTRHHTARFAPRETPHARPQATGGVPPKPKRPSRST